MISVTENPVHPRVCGEHYLALLHAHDAGGSSPRLRGTRGRVPATRGDQRFIPASAGNTFSLFLGLAPASVHPRVCGEHSWEVGSMALGNGSSPRLRGTLSFGAVPASRSTVHPRVCGEHPRDAVFRTLMTGSSPRLRGTPNPNADSMLATRFIPASAGNTP